MSPKKNRTSSEPDVNAQQLAMQLVNEFDKVDGFRKTPSEIIFAIDPLLLHMMVAPQKKTWQRLLPLLGNDEKDGQSFTVDMQGVSLARRVARHILLGGTVGNAQSQRALLHGHAQEFVRATDTYHRAANDVRSIDQIDDAVRTTQTLWFNTFAGAQPATNQEEISRRIDQAIAHVPDTFFAALGVSEAQVRWQSCAEVMRSRMIVPLTPEILSPSRAPPDRQDLPSTAADKDIDSFIVALQQDGATEGENENVSRVLVSDAMALAHLRRVNIELGRQKPERRCVLVTNSAPILSLLAKMSATEFGAPKTKHADEMTAADHCLLDPYAFLDECHLHLTGSITHDPTLESRGRLSKALRIFGAVRASAGQSGDAQESSTREFSEVWGSFLRASVLEQLQSERSIHSKRRREVLYALRRSGISTVDGKNQLFVRALTDRGAQMMLEAADIAIASNQAEDFVRGAPFLRLDCHPIAEKLQWLKPQEFTHKLLDDEIRHALREEAQSQYTVHLMQARALVWEERWSAATILTEFTLGLKDTLKSIGIQVGRVDGREAYLLASYCVRMHKATPAGLQRARGFVNSFKLLAEANSALSDQDKRLHALRADAEELAIATMEVLEAKAPRTTQISRKIPEVTVPMDDSELQQKCADAEGSALALASTIQCDAIAQENNATMLSAYLTAQQCWVNRAQIALLCSEQNNDLVTLASMLWNRRVEIQSGIRKNCPNYLVGESRFTRFIALLTKVCAGKKLTSQELSWMNDMLRTGQIQGSASYAEWRYDALTKLFRRQVVN